MKTIKFTKPWQIYSRGDVAGFEPALADKLVAGNMAVLHGEKAEAEAEPEGEAKADAKSAKAAK